MTQLPQPSLRWAMLIYLALALVAAFELTGKFRIAVWIFLAGLAVKTLIAWAARR